MLDSALIYNTDMQSTDLTTSGRNWAQEIAALRENLSQLRTNLVDAETELAERLAEISAFEFELKARITPFTRLLDKLDAEIQQLRLKLRLRGSLAEDETLDAFAAAQWTHEQTVHESADYRYRKVNAYVIYE